FSSSDLLVKVRQETPKAQASLPPQWSIGRMAICQLRGTRLSRKLAKIFLDWEECSFWPQVSRTVDIHSRLKKIINVQERITMSLAGVNLKLAVSCLFLISLVSPGQTMINQQAFNQLDDGTPV